MKKKMSTGKIALISVVVVLILMLLWVWSGYNGLVSSDESVNQKWGNVQSSYQRRLDLIPNLVQTVKASAEFETNLQTQVANLRSGVSNAKSPQDLANIGAQIETAINVAFEAYPEIKSTENFLSLQDQLEGTENRINFARNEYNEAVNYYNVKVRRFPTNIIAGWFGFSKRDMFEADSGAENAVNVGEIFDN